MSQILLEFFGPIAAAVTFGAWLVRLEFRANQNANDLAKLEARWSDQRREDMARHNREWEAMNRRLDTLDSKIDGLPDRFAALVRHNEIGH
jgi:hypothetical protein